MMPCVLQASIVMQVSFYEQVKVFGKAATAENVTTKAGRDVAPILDDMAESYGNGTGIFDEQSGNLQIDIRMHLAPFIQGFMVEGQAELFSYTVELDANTAELDRENLLDEKDSKPKPQTVLKYRITYRRSTFTRLFAMAIVVCMWVLSVYLFILAVDHVIVRRRDLMPDTIGFAVGMLFALPALRLLLDVPLGR
jgi:hypothetical protein